MSFHRIALLPILLTALMLNPERGLAEPVQQTISARLTTEYVSNPYLTASTTDEVWRGLFEPGYLLTGRFGNDEIKTGLGLQIARSSNGKLSPDRDSPSMFMDWIHQMETGEFGMSTRIAEVATRDAETDAASLIPAAGTRTSRLVSGKALKELGEHNSLLADVSYERVSYVGSAYINYATRMGSMTLNNTWSDKDSIFIKISYADFEPSNGGALSRMDIVSLGWIWNATDHFDGNLQVSKYKLSTGDIGNESSLVFQYKGQQTLLILNASRQVAPSGLGNFAITDQVNGSWKYDLSATSQTGMDLGWRKNIDLGLVNHTAGIWLQQELDTFWGVRTYYLQNTLYGGAIDGATSKTLGLTFVYTHADF